MYTTRVFQPIKGGSSKRLRSGEKRQNGITSTIGEPTVDAHFYTTLVRKNLGAGGRRK